MASRLAPHWHDAASRPLAAKLGACLLMTFASAVAHAAAWSVTPQVQARATYTDNIALDRPGQERDETVLELTPGISLRGEGTRLKLNFDYSFQRLYYLKESDHNTYNNFLAAAASLEAIEKWFYIDAAAHITQQNISAFGAQPLDNTNTTNNRVNVYDYSLNPYIKGLISDASYEVRYNAYAAHSGASQLARSESNEWLAKLRGSAAPRLFNWGADYDRRLTHYTGTNDYETETYRGSLFFRPNAQLSLSARAGHEKNNLLLGKQSSGTWGVGFQWTPDERTFVSGDRDHRLFGLGYAFLLRHRMPRSAIDIAITRDLTSTPDILFFRPNLTFAQLLAAAMSPPPEGVPDDRLANATARLGSLANIVPTLAFLTNRVVLEKRAQATYALIGVRNTVALSAVRSTSQAVTAGFAAIDDFSLADQIVSRGVSLNWNYIVSPMTSLNAVLSHTRSTGTGAIEQTLSQNSANLLMTRKLSPKLTASFGARHVQASGNLTYREKALFAGIVAYF